MYVETNEAYYTVNAAGEYVKVCLRHITISSNSETRACARTHRYTCYVCR